MIAQIKHALLAGVIILISAMGYAKPASPDTTVIMNKLTSVWSMHFRNMDSALILSRECYQLSKLPGNEKLKARALHMLGVIEQEAGNLPISIKYLDSALILAQAQKDFKRVGQVYNSIGASYSKMGNWKASIKYTSLAAKIKEENGDLKGSVISYLNIAVQYSQISDTAAAIKYAERAVEICRKNKVNESYTQAVSMLGEFYLMAQKNEKAEECFNTVLDSIDLNAEPAKGIEPYKGLAEIYYQRGNANACLAATQQMDKLIAISGSKNALVDLYSNYAKYYYLVKDYKQCEINSKKAMEMVSFAGVVTDITVPMNFYVLALKGQNRLAEAFKVLERLTQIKDSLNEANNSEGIRRMQAEFEDERKENQIKNLHEKTQLRDAELKQKNYLIVFGIIAFVVVCFALVTVFVVYKRNKSTLKLLEVRTREVEEKNNIITTKNKDITDSIYYAKRIQDAFMPEAAVTDKLFKEYFILFQPKDILSGDFYWFGEKESKKIIAVADCTGHGVPGAFLSVAGSSFLNEIINQRGITDPKEVLSELRHLIIKSLKQTGAEGEARDGMDIGIICLDEKNKTMDFAGANNSLIMVRKEESDIMFEEVKGDRRSVGYFRGKGLPFNSTRINYQSGDTIYMFSDGMADQFGGPSGKKFKRKSLLELLAGYRKETMSQQKAMLESTLVKWKGNLEQTDDILIVGIRL